MTDEAKYIAWLCLKTAPDIGPKRAQKLVEMYGSPLTFVGHADHPIYREAQISAKAATHLAESCLPKCYPQICKLMEHYSISYTCLGDEDYPDYLSEIFSPPLILYYRGDLQTALDRKRLGVVGTRKPSSYGREMCKKLLAPVASKGVCIISGLAMGIDTVSHQTALEANSHTVAVLASGVEDVYPTLNRELAKKIIEHGALVSEYEPGSKMERWNFPARNRIISALSHAVFVVEGPLSSGALLTAKFALEQNREVLALPGNINVANAQGPNYLIKSGAITITCAEDFFAILDLEDDENSQLEIFPELSDNETKIYEIFQTEQRDLSFDELIVMTKDSFGQLSIALLNLELKGLIGKSGGNAYILL